MRGHQEGEPAVPGVCTHVRVCTQMCPVHVQVCYHVHKDTSRAHAVCVLHVHVCVHTCMQV